MKRLCLVFFFSLALLPALPAAPALPATGAVQTIERNLTYVRVHTLPDDLPAVAAAATGTLVLDLRFVTASPEVADNFAGWLKARARAQAPVLALVNRDTAATLLAQLSPPRVPAGVVSLGLASTPISPDIVLDLDAGADRTAYEAFEHGLSIDELINPKIDKVRHDEAAMARDRAAETNAAAADEIPLPAPEEKTKAPAAVAPVDRVLQRAVQLHHALLALRKL